jgi:hypothetical protein
MRSMVNIYKWAELNFPRPLFFKPLSTNKPALAIAGFILIAFAGIIVWALVDMVISELDKQGTMNWPYLVVAILSVVGSFLFVRLILVRRKLNIIKIDKEAITTIDGKLF